MIMIIDFLSDLARILMIMGIIVLTIYYFYLLWDKKEKQQQQLLTENHNFLTRVLIKVRDLGKKVRER